MAEVTGHDFTIDGIDLSRLGSIDPAQREKEYQFQLAQMTARIRSKDTEGLIIRQRLTQLQQQKAGLERQSQSIVEQSRLLTDELEGVRALAERGYAPQTRVRALERNAAALTGELGALDAQIARTVEQMIETRLQLESLDARSKEDVTEQIRQIDYQLAELVPETLEVRRMVERGLVRSPSSGSVIALTGVNVGSVIMPGRSILEIVPASHSDIIVARISPFDRDNIEVGMEAELKFPAFRDRNPPKLTGTVKLVSADTLSDEAAREEFYEIRIGIIGSSINKLNDLDGRLYPGMPVEIVIPGRRRSLLSYLTEPLLRSVWLSGRG